MEELISAWGGCTWKVAGGNIDYNGISSHAITYIGLPEKGVFGPFSKMMYTRT